MLRYIRGQCGSMMLEYTIGMLIMGLIAYTAITNLGSTKADAYDSIAQSWVSTLNTATMLYKRDIGTYPPDLPSLAVMNGTKGPWVQMVPTTDPWGMPYQYNSTTGIVFSLGADHTAATSDDIRLR